MARSARRLWEWEILQKQCNKRVTACKSALVILAGTARASRPPSPVANGQLQRAHRPHAMSGWRRGVGVWIEVEIQGIEIGDLLEPLLVEDRHFSMADL